MVTSRSHQHETVVVGQQMATALSSAVVVELAVMGGSSEARAAFWQLSRCHGELTRQGSW